MTFAADLIVNIMQMNNLFCDRSKNVMDWRTREFDQSSVDSFPGEDKGVLKSKSYLNLPGLEDLENYSERIKESKGFTSAFENLKLDIGINQQFDRSPSPKTKDTGTSPFEYNLEASPPCGFRTHEKSTLRLVIQGPEILNHQGTIHSANEVAPFWKKDSRMWLWKSVRYARRRNKAKYSIIQSSSNNRHDGFK